MEEKKRNEIMINKKTRYLRDRVNGDFVALPVHLLDRGIVGILVRYEEGGLDVAAIRVFAFTVEDLLVQANVVIVDGIVESYRDHLGYVLGWEIARYRGTVLRAETVRQNAYGGVAGWCPIGIIVHIWNVEKIAIVQRREISFIPKRGFCSFAGPRCFSMSETMETRCELLTANVLIGPIGTILLSVAEETSLDTGSVSAREVAVLAERLFGIE